MSVRSPHLLHAEVREEDEKVSPAVAARSGSLRLLKSKLRASGKGRRKANQQIVSIQVKAAEPNASVLSATNQQDEAAHIYPQAPGATEAQQLSSRPEKAGVLSVRTDGCNQKQEDAEPDSQALSLVELKRVMPEPKEVSGQPPSRQEHELVATMPSAELQMTVAPNSFPIQLKSYTKTVIQWSCSACERECIPVREESRCLCGHRYKEHPSSAEDPRVKSKAKFRAFACTSARCKCKHFFYVVAEGAWILRCRCKHKHTDHDAGAKPHACTKPKCACTGFDSPWVCNCDHAWAVHRQKSVERRFDPLQLLQAQCEAPELNAVHRTDLLTSPLHLGL